MAAGDARMGRQGIEPPTDPCSSAPQPDVLKVELCHKPAELLLKSTSEVSKDRHLILRTVRRF